MTEQTATAEGSGESGETTSGGEQGNRLERHNAKLAGENKELKTQLTQLQTTVKELEGLKTEKDQAAEKLAREQGRWEEVLAKKDKTIEELTGKVSGFESELGQLRNKDFERQVLDRIQAESTEERSIVRGTYIAFVEDRGIERFPVDKDVEKVAKERLKGMSEYAPKLFGSEQPTGGTPRNKPKQRGAERVKL